MSAQPGPDTPISPVHKCPGDSEALCGTALVEAAHGIWRRAAGWRLLATDVRQEGWGAVHAGFGVRGPWTGNWMGQHINALELMAMLLVLQHFLLCLQGLLVCRDDQYFN